MTDQLINCAANPYIPNSSTLLSHRKSGPLTWDKDAVRLYLSESQRQGGAIQGQKFLQELEDKPVLNAAVLDYLLAHPKLIPETWKEKTEGKTTFVFFWGSIYSEINSGPYVRCIYWDGLGWDERCEWLDKNFYFNYPAALGPG